MNLLYLPKHISSITDSPVRAFERTGGGLWKETLEVGPDKQPPVPLPGIIREWLQKPLDRPQIVSVNTLLYFAIVPVEQYRVLLGPVQLTSPLHLKRNYLNVEDAPATHALCDTLLFIDAVLFPWNLFAPKEMQPAELIAANCSESANVDVQRYFSKITYENRETNSHHNGYSQEVRMLGSIETGDLKLLEQCQNESSTGEFGKLSPSYERSIRNVCIAAVVLASRAAIRGGLHPETAFSLCDSYIIKIENTYPIDKVKTLVEGAQTNYAALVHSLQETGTEKRDGSTSHPLVKKCENYIYDHLHGKTTLKDAANELGVAPNYLSTLFKRCEGISFSEFVIREKISLAKEMLIYSPLSYRDIALTLGFSSQSHMGEHFKKLTGMTPIQYKNRYAVTETPL